MIGLALTLATFGALAVLDQADGPATPTRAEVQAALLAFLNSNCGPTGAECNHPYGAALRGVRCTPQAGNRARCRMQERIAHLYIQRPRWQRAEYKLAYDAASGRWALDCRTQSTPSAGPSVQIISCN